MWAIRWPRRPSWACLYAVLFASACGGEPENTAFAGAAGSVVAGTQGQTGAGVPSSGKGAAGVPASSGGAGSTAQAGRAGANAGAGAAAVSGSHAGVAAGSGAGAGASGEQAGSGGGAGSAGHAGSSPAVDEHLPPGLSGLFPRANASDVCADAPLRLTFPSAPKLGTRGKISVWKASGQVAATIDLSAARSTEQVAGASYAITQRAWLDGNDVTFVLPARSLSYGQTYYVTIESGVIAGNSFSIDDPMTWRFSTAAAGPSDRTNIKVALDGTGAFCSPQAALDALPARNDKPVTITLGEGTYYGLVQLTSKHQITLHGVDRERSVIAGINNENLNGGTAKRALFGVDDSHNLTIENLTIHNLTAQGGSQAEALRMQRCDQCVVRDANILSLQDTLLWSGRVYARNCLIAGNVDFVWGTGAAFFDRCEIRTIGRAGYVVQARNPASTYGYVFVDSKLTSDVPLSNNALGRVDVSVYPASHVAYVNCQMDSHISGAGWTITGGGAPTSLRFWEYQTTDLNGQMRDVSKRLAGSKQITASQAAMMRDPKVVLAGWQPPNN